MLRTNPGITYRNANGSNCPVIVNSAYTRSFESLTGTSGVTVTPAATTVTSGATSATQTVGSTVANPVGLGAMAVGDTLTFGTSTTGIIQSITNSTTVVLTASIAIRLVRPYRFLIRMGRQ